jgi:hypothetical protein
MKKILSDDEQAATVLKVFFAARSCMMQRYEIAAHIHCKFYSRRVAVTAEEMAQPLTSRWLH